MTALPDKYLENQLRYSVVGAIHLSNNWSRQLVSLVLIPLTVIYPGDTERYPTFQQPGPGRYVLALYPVYSQSGSGQIMRRLSFLH